MSSRSNASKMICILGREALASEKPNTLTDRDFDEVYGLYKTSLEREFKRDRDAASLVSSHTDFHLSPPAQDGGFEVDPRVGSLRDKYVLICKERIRTLISARQDMKVGRTSAAGLLVGWVPDHADSETLTLAATKTKDHRFAFWQDNFSLNEDDSSEYPTFSQACQSLWTLLGEDPARFGKPYEVKLALEKLVPQEGKTAAGPGTAEYNDCLRVANLARLMTAWTLSQSEKGAALTRAMSSETGKQALVEEIKSLMPYIGLRE